MKKYEYETIPIEKKKKIAIIAHDNRKLEIAEWALKNKELLENHLLFGTGTTAKLVSEATGLSISPLKSGPLGGDQQVGAMIAEGDLDVLLFFWDPLEAQPHDPDVKALLRVAVLYNILIATNRTTADFVFSSEKMKEVYPRQLIDFAKRATPM